MSLVKQDDFSIPQRAVGFQSQFPFLLCAVYHQYGAPAGIRCCQSKKFPGVFSGKGNPGSEAVKFAEHAEDMIGWSDILAREIEESAVGSCRFRVVIHRLVDGRVLQAAEGFRDKKRSRHLLHGDVNRFPLACGIDEIPFSENVFRPGEAGVPEFFRDVFRVGAYLGGVRGVEMPGEKIQRRVFLADTQEEGVEPARKALEITACVFPCDGIETA